VTLGNHRHYVMILTLALFFSLEVIVGPLTYSLKWLFAKPLGPSQELATRADHTLIVLKGITDVNLLINCASLRARRTRE
jgi:hypothetical protein